MCFRFLKLLLILLFSLAFLAGSDVCVSKAALMTSCLALGLALIMVDSLWLSKSQNQEIGNQSLFSILSQYRWHPCWAWLAWAIYMGIRILQTPNHHYLLTHGYSLIIGSLGFIIGFLLLFYQSKKPWLMNVWLWTLGIICFIQIIFCILQFTVDSNLIVHERSVARESDYVKGTYFFEGGFVYQINVANNFIMVAAETDSSGRWANNNNDVQTTTGEGYINTVNMAANGSQLGNAALNSLREGFDDWYIPSQNEFNVLYSNSQYTGNFTYNNYNYGDVYFTSTQNPNNLNEAMAKGFYSGSSYGHSKTSSRKTRFVRKTNYN